jgi:hypothetical protein
MVDVLIDVRSSLEVSTIVTRTVFVIESVRREYTLLQMYSHPTPLFILMTSISARLDLLRADTIYLRLQA